MSLGIQTESAERTEFRPVRGFETRYAVSRDGRVWSFVRGRLIKQHLDHQGYPISYLWDGSRLHSCKIHRLIYAAWVRPLEEGELVLHQDDDKTNLSLENLYVGTHAQNVADKVRNGIAFWLNITHCPAGHEYTEENTYLQPRGRGDATTRVCRACRRQQDHARQGAHSEARRNKKKEL